VDTPSFSIRIDRKGLTGLPLKNFLDQSGENVSGTNFDENTPARRANVLYLFGKQNRLKWMVLQKFPNFARLIGIP
jgi:hypothetical protein